MCVVVTFLVSFALTIPNSGAVACWTKVQSRASAFLLVRDECCRDWLKVEADASAYQLLTNLLIAVADIQSDIVEEFVSTNVLHLHVQ